MTLASSIQDRLDAGDIIIMDGATGTEFSRRGIPIDPNLTWSAQPNLTASDIVRSIHEDHIRAGAEIIITNTFSTSRATLAKAGLGDRTAEINQRAVLLAQEARRNCRVEGSVVIAGSMSSFEPKDEPTVVPSYTVALKDYKEQAILLAEGGVDVIVLEMFVRTVDAAAAVEAATATGLPIWVGFSCENYDGRLNLGLLGRHANETIADAVGATTAANVTAFAIMHSPPEDTALGLHELKKNTSLPLAAYAHAGDYEAQSGNAPRVSSTDHISPTRYLEYARDWMRLGAQIIGGCCGTTPEHIQALSESLPRQLSI